MFLTGSRNFPQSIPSMRMKAFPVAMPPYFPNSRIISIDCCWRLLADARSPEAKAAIKSRYNGAA